MPTKVVFQRLADDPLCLRISIGGREEIGYYCMFRGNQKEVVEALRLISGSIPYIPELDIEEEPHLKS
jgi:hypothetical protein